MLHAKYPKHNLVFRNLATAADDVGGFLNTVAKGDSALRNRSENFGSNDQWLTSVKADVVFAFFGYNESFRGDAGLEKFKADLDTFVKETKAKNYSGKAAPRLVLFGPLAAEKSSDPNLPPVDATNANLKKYSAVVADVAKANDVAFVDLFAISLDGYAQAAKQKKALTFNTIHLTEAGDKALAPEIFRTVEIADPLR
ncbi:MAG: dehydrogenase, partial [Verrucomicrobia bacterium]|nr:dehydrogenase [Verrucomicrobiota bacterium]